MSEIDWIRRAISHCDVWGRRNAGLASVRAHEWWRGRRLRMTGYGLRRMEAEDSIRAADNGVGIAAGWLPEWLRDADVDELREQVAEHERVCLRIEAAFNEMVEDERKAGRCA